MQRENSILNKPNLYTKDTLHVKCPLGMKRSGFAMIMAIFVIVIVGTLMALMISMSATSLKRTTNLYLNEQAILLARSATEYALLAISGTDRTAGCLTDINSSYNPEGTTNPMFNITTTIKYIGLSTECGGNDNYIINADVTALNSRGSILMDVVVESDPSLGIGETIRYHRRTLQKL